MLELKGLNPNHPDTSGQSAPLQLALIYGSTREGRFCDIVAQWAAGEVRKHGGFELDVIDPAALALPWRHERKLGPEVLALRERIAQADAFLIVTPEYNHSYPAALKFVIDSVYEEWRAKPVAFVSYGGISGGLRAVEHLRQVFAELHAVSVRDTVSFANAWEQFDATGELKDPGKVARGMAALLTQLQWWSRLLRHARKAAPYLQTTA